MDLFLFIEICCLVVVCHKAIDAIVEWTIKKLHKKPTKNRVFDANVLLEQHSQKVWKQLRSCLPVLQCMLDSRHNLHADDPSIEDVKGFLQAMYTTRNMLPTAEVIETLELLFNNSNKNAEYESWITDIKQIVLTIETCIRDAFVDTKQIIDRSLAR